MFGLITGGLKLLSKTKLGKKVMAKASGAVGKVLAKIGKKNRAGKNNKTDDVMTMAMDRSMNANNAVTKGSKFSLGAGEEEGQHPVSDALGDFLGRVKDKAGPLETKVGVDKTMIYVGVGAALLLVLGISLSKR